MSEVTLHGYPVNVGDKVWLNGIIEDKVVEVDESDSNTPFRLLGYDWYCIDDPRRFVTWQPIDQSAIEAAKVKKEPEYEYLWLDTRDKNIEWLGSHTRHTHPDWIRIEESKREVQS